MTTPEDLRPPTMDREVGTYFDWVDWPSTMFTDDQGRIVQQSERIFVSDVEEMLRTDGTAQSIETALTMPLRQANTTFEKPVKDKGQTKFIADAFNCKYENGGMETSLDLIIAQMTLGASIRKTYHEKVWTRRKDGKIVYKKVAWRPPSSCELLRGRKHGEILGFRQFQDGDVTRGTNKDGYVEIEARNSLIYIHGQHRDPLSGVSDLQVTHWAHQLKQKLLFLWSLFLSNQGLPKLVAYGKDPTEATNNAQKLAGLRSSGVLGMVRNSPDDKLFELLETSGQGASQFNEMINYLDSQASRSVMAGWLDLTTSANSGTGSYALSSDQSGIFLASRYAVAKEIAETITRQLIAPLVWLNFGPDVEVPRLVFEKISTDQAAKAMGMLQQLGAAQTMNVPAGFIDLLMERVAQYLDLDDEKVAEIIDQRQQQAQQQAEAAGRPPEQSATPQGQLSDKVQAIWNTVVPGGNVGVATPGDATAQGAAPVR
jgi:hypothetical protein